MGGRNRDLRRWCAARTWGANKDERASSTGANLNETVLTPSNVNSSSFGQLASTPVNGQVYAQPLYVENVNVDVGGQQGPHDVVFAATGGHGWITDDEAYFHTRTRGLDGPI
jgi:hypothetical protein